MQQSSRRTFIKAAAAVGAAAAVPGLTFAAPADQPNSKFNGVQIGVITYSYRGTPSSAEDLLGYLLACGLSSVELMGDAAEKFAGRGADAMQKYADLRKMYSDAGVNIHIVKFGNIGDAGMSDAQIEHYFNAAKALGAKGITREMDENAAKRLGSLADKHKIWIGFHNHTQLKPDTYDGPMLSHGKYLGINFDIGHYVAGTNCSPIPFIEKYKDRILSLHLKDRKVNNGPNMPFGQGDTPVALVLNYMKQNKLTFPADIELEYKVPADSNPVKEVTTCVQFCKAALGA
ncbi:MAG: twin-arginine translocation signal domain-containing protein [Phycisphaerae bacterium]|nr:twin-arginine translocation signal domain-containing protein [Phycisphaerae bacterium]